MRTLDRWRLLAADTFSYSYENYANHEGNVRFDRYMPDDVRILERANREKWPILKLAAELERSEEDSQKLIDRFREALEIVDAPNPAESFRRSVRQAIKVALRDGLNSDEQIESLVIQICYRASDLSYLLRSRNEPLHKYSDLLRREPGVKYMDDDA